MHNGWVNVRRLVGSIHVILRRLAEEKDHKREKRENRPETAGTHEKRDR